MNEHTPATLTPPYVTPPSHWPIVGSIALTGVVTGFVHFLHHSTLGPWMGLFGAALLIYMLFGWFRTVIAENQAGLYKDEQLNVSFRWGMAWFIFSEVMFFAVFFGTLFYIRTFTLPHLAGYYISPATHILLWPGFKLQWPLFQTPNPADFLGPKSVMNPWGIPAMNTLILLTSGATITVAHWAILQNQRHRAIVFQFLTILLGIAFLCLQVHEYGLAYTHDGLTLGSGIYGSLFFMLTGFHGLHVTIGTLMLMVILGRILKGHFTATHHFAFEAVAWYWHFVDVVWLGLFIFVYWF